MEILANGDCIRHQSIDFTLPEQFVIHSTAGRVLVPVSLMTKGPLSRFSASGPHGRPVPVLETASNGRLAVAMLRMMASNAYGYPIACEPVGAPELLYQIVHEWPSDSSSLIDRLSILLKPFARGCDPDQDRNRTTFLAIARQFCTCFLLLVELESEVVGTRSILKFSYLEPRNDPVSKPRTSLKWSVDDFGLTASYHFEFEPPPLLSISRICLIERIGDSPPKIVRDERSESAGNIGHLTTRPEDAVSAATVVVVVVPRHHGVAAISYYAAVIVLIVLVGINVVRCARTILGSSVSLATPTAAAILLAGGGVLLTWIARTPEDWIVSKVLHAPRLLIAGLAFLLLLAACLIVLPVPESVRSGVWLLFLTFGFLAFWRSWLYRKRSRIKAPTTNAADLGSDFASS